MSELRGEVLSPWPPEILKQRWPGVRGREDGYAERRSGTIITKAPLNTNSFDFLHLPCLSLRGHYPLVNKTLLSLTFYQDVIYITCLNFCSSLRSRGLAGNLGRTPSMGHTYPGDDFQLTKLILCHITWTHVSRKESRYDNRPTRIGSGISCEPRMVLERPEVGSSPEFVRSPPDPGTQSWNGTPSFNLHSSLHGEWHPIYLEVNWDQESLWLKGQQ